MDPSTLNQFLSKCRHGEKPGMVVKGLAEWISWNSAASRTNLRIQSCKCFLKTRCMDVSSSENRSSMCCPLTKIGVEEAHIVWQSLRVAMAIAPLKGPTKKAALLPCIISLVCRIESRDELIKEIKPSFAGERRFS